MSMSCLGLRRRDGSARKRCSGAFSLSIVHMGPFLTFCELLAGAGALGIGHRARHWSSVSAWDWILGQLVHETRSRAWILVGNGLFSLVMCVRSAICF